MQVQVTVDGKTQDVTIGFETTLQESFALEEFLGVEGYERLVADTEAGHPFRRPSQMRALIYVKLSSRFPGIDPDDFDIEMKSLIEAATAEEDLGKDQADSE